MNFDADTLYSLLPAVYRIRDAEQGEPLKTLFQVLAREVAVLETDLEQLYENQFIETCSEWVVPYIGDLIGHQPVYSNKVGFPSSRAVVANTIGYRRRKSTPAMLEQLARDVTGWPARAVEFFELLATTQYLNHLRPHNLGTPNLRLWQPLEYLGTPFETTSHTVEVRRIPPRRGRYNIPNIGLFLWRLQPYTIGQFSDTEENTNVPVLASNVLGTARAVQVPADGRYTFHPIGLDAPLFNPQLQEELFSLADPINVPEPFQRRVLYEELEAWRQSIANGQTDFQPLYFHTTENTLSPAGARGRAFEIFINDSSTPIPAEEVVICNLTNWRRPPSTKDYQPQPIVANEDPVSLPLQVSIDPLLGRIAFPEGVIPDSVLVRYTYGFSADIGGGPYDRNQSVSPILERPVTWQRGVTLNADASETDLVSTLSEAITEWNTLLQGNFGVIALLDNRTYDENFPRLVIPTGSQLLIVAADWPTVEVEDSPTPQRQLGQLSPKLLRPHLRGNLVILGTAPEGSDIPGDIILNGVLLEGSVTVQGGNLDRLHIEHSTLVPFTSDSPIPDSINIEANNELLALTLDHVISGPINIAESIELLTVTSSLIDGANDRAINASTTPTNIETSTILGTTNFRSLEASNSIFTKIVSVSRRQQGCVRFSSLPILSQAPRRYRCQPNLALAELAKASNLSTIEDPDLRLHVERRLSPDFTSQRYGDPNYGQLSHRCALQIREGADDEAEMGVFHNLFQPQRETNLRVRLDEYLRFGVEAGIFYTT